jgi:hypothetical protein
MILHFEHATSQVHLPIYDSGYEIVTQTKDRNNECNSSVVQNRKKIFYIFFKRLSILIRR